MNQILVYLKRLKKPSVVLSIVSQVIILLTMFNVNVDKNLIINATVAILTILAAMGVVSNPDSTTGYNDDIILCSGCGKETLHAVINGEYICVECATKNTIVK